MKKLFFVVFALCSLFFVQARANVVTGVAKIPENYYDDVDGKKSPDAILTALCDIIDEHTVIGYSSLEPYYKQTDFYADTLWDMYSTCRFVYEDANKQQQKVCDGWNKEHVCCQSWLGSGPMVSDLFNVYPTDARINNLRSNHPYGVVGSFDSFSKDPDKHGLGKLGTSKLSGYTSKVYEPADEYKGDFARTFMYMVARYRNNILNGDSNGKAMFTSNPTQFTDYSLSFLLDWHRNDPVSEKEIDRNQAIYGIQKNRNPFIDYPDLAEYIWGTKKGEQVNLASMTATCDGGTATPIIIIKYGVDWMVNGQKIQIDSIRENKKIAAFPEKPLSCSTQSEEFVGWTNTPIVGTSDDVPAVLYTAAKDIDVITQDTAFYAVFAHKEIEENAAPATYSYAMDNETAGWTNTAAKNNGYWILKSDTYLESPEISLSGLTSITMTLRTYGGADYNTVHISANDKEIGTLEAADKNLKSYTWEKKDQTLTGLAPLRFIGSASTTQYGVAFSTVSINATGAGAVFSRYLTNCEDEIPTNAIKPETEEPFATKILINGQLFIRLNGKIYTLTGQNVK